MKKATQLIIELWSKVYCPARQLAFTLQQPASTHMFGIIERMLQHCMRCGYNIYICICMPDDFTASQRIELQSEIARPFNRDCDDWNASNHIALLQFSLLSPQQQEICLRIPFMTTAEIAADMNLEYTAVRSAERKIHAKLNVSTKTEITSMLITAEVFNAEQVKRHSDFFKAVRSKLEEEALMYRA